MNVCAVFGNGLCLCAFLFEMGLQIYKGFLIPGVVLRHNHSSRSTVLTVVRLWIPSTQDEIPMRGERAVIDQHS